MTVNLAGYSGGGVEDLEQVDTALAGIRDEYARLIDAGTKIVIG